MNDTFLTLMTTSGWIAAIGVSAYMSRQIKSVIRDKDRTIDAKDSVIKSLDRLVGSLSEDLRHLRASSVTDLPPWPRRRGGETAVLGVGLKRSVAGEPVPVVTRVRPETDHSGPVDPFILGVMMGQSIHTSSTPSAKSDDSACSAPSSSSSCSDTSNDSSSSCSSSESGSSGGGGD